jgi:hypothetical protein
MAGGWVCMTMPATLSTRLSGGTLGSGLRQMDNKPSGA